MQLGTSDGTFKRNTFIFQATAYSAVGSLFRAHCRNLFVYEVRRFAGIGSYGKIADGGSQERSQKPESDQSAFADECPRACFQLQEKHRSRNRKEREIDRYVIQESA
ncbi:hypothetical protein SDC9_139711 [bioreactor metagenome]|uniref:Uncharacterized protein n=1 Tax=bioreactor metagenome TaxID=1076179 RepID=A0A645DTB7_9ZZZZ